MVWKFGPTLSQFVSLFKEVLKNNKWNNLVFLFLTTNITSHFYKIKCKEDSQVLKYRLHNNINTKSGILKQLCYLKQKC